MHYVFFFFFNDTATTEIYTLSLHDALPIFDLHVALPLHQAELHLPVVGLVAQEVGAGSLALDEADLLYLARDHQVVRDRKSTRLNSSHANISYAVFCLKKKN